MQDVGLEQAVLVVLHLGGHREEAARRGLHRADAPGVRVGAARLPPVRRALRQREVRPVVVAPGDVRGAQAVVVVPRTVGRAQDAVGVLVVDVVELVEGVEVPRVLAREVERGGEVLDHLALGAHLELIGPRGGDAGQDGVE
ncbi:MAG: hypothetical protein ACK559_12840, partial [bacterium]